MSVAVQQFLEIIRTTWRSVLYCGQCGTNTEHIGREVARNEIYRCTICNSEKWYTVK
jgi:transposase-like protein